MRWVWTGRWRSSPSSSIDCRQQSLRPLSRTTVQNLIFSDDPLTARIRPAIWPAYARPRPALFRKAMQFLEGGSLSPRGLSVIGWYTVTSCHCRVFAFALEVSCLWGGGGGLLLAIHWGLDPRHVGEARLLQVGLAYHLASKVLTAQCRPMIQRRRLLVFP